MFDDFNPGLPGAERQPLELVTPAKLPFFRTALSIMGAAAGIGQEKTRSATGREIWLFGAHDEIGAPRRPALLWIHGGGYVLGHPSLDRRFAGRIASELDIIVACPAYRFAPRHPYPAALNDVTAALDWLSDHPCVDPRRIAVGGDSAGAGLAAALAIRTRDSGRHNLAFQVLHEPMLDHRTPDEHPHEDRLRVWSPRMNRYAWNAYLRNVDGPVPDTASPALLKDASGLPPAFLGIGTRDLFVDEARAYADRLEQAGVSVQRNLVQGAYHGFNSAEPAAPLSRDYEDRIIEALGRAFRN